MVSGTDEHGTPVMVAADAAGESPRETADRFNEFIREDLRALGLSYDLFTRTTTRNHYRVTQDLFRTLHEKGFVVERETLGAFSASTGHTLPDRYIEGTCPICGFHDGARRPVRQLREPARSDRPDRPALEDRRHASGLPEDEAPLPRSAGVQGAAHRMDRGQGWLAAERPPLLAQLREGAQAASDHARSRLGRSDSGRGLRGTRRQADLRVVRRGHRLPVGIDRVGRAAWNPRCVARVVAGRRRRAHVLHGEGQHRLPHRDLAEHAARVRKRWRRTARGAAP